MRGVVNSAILLSCHDYMIDILHDCQVVTLLYVVIVVTFCFLFGAEIL